MQLCRPFIVPLNIRAISTGKDIKSLKPKFGISREYLKKGLKIIAG